MSERFDWLNEPGTLVRKVCVSLRAQCASWRFFWRQQRELLNLVSLWDAST